MNADIPPRPVWIPRQYIINDGCGFEDGVVFGIQSWKGRALQFHVLLKSGAHFRHVPLHWLYTAPLEEYKPQTVYSLEDLQLWDCFSYRPVVTVFDMLRDYECDAILRDKTKVSGTYWFTVDWLPDSDERSGWLHIPEQNKLAHVIVLDNGQVACLPTNRVAFKDAYFIGNTPDPGAKRYKTIAAVWSSENCDRWSVADKDETFY